MKTNDFPRLLSDFLLKELLGVRNQSNIWILHHALNIRYSLMLLLGGWIMKLIGRAMYMDKLIKVMGIPGIMVITGIFVMHLV